MLAAQGECWAWFLSSNFQAYTEIEFDISSLSQSCLSNVQLFLTKPVESVFSVGDSNFNFDDFAGVSFNIRYLDPTSWASNSITWNNQPSSYYALETLQFVASGSQLSICNVESELCEYRHQILFKQGFFGDHAN
jgi:hypothetical protein